jgi:lysophospholipase L1-like esterase
MGTRVRTIALIAVLGVAACGGHRSPISPPPPPSDGGNNGGGQPPPPPPPPPPTLKVTRIVAFGDSITEGTTSPAVQTLTLDAGKPDSYPYKLQVLETARYSAQTITVINAGSAGKRAQEDRGRLSDALSAAQPEVLLLMEGTNDLGLLTLPGLSNKAIQDGITATVNAMEDMVRDAQRRGVAVFVATILPQRASRASGAALVAPYNTALKAMIAKKGATLVDANAQFPLDMIGQDGLHPTDAGYGKLAEIFQTALANVYEVPPGGTSSIRP